MPADEPKPFRFHARLSDEDDTLFDEVCRHLGIDRSNALRIMLREKHRALGLARVNAKRPARRE